MNENLILKHNQLAKVTKQCPTIYEIDFINSCLSGTQMYKQSFPSTVFTPVDVDNFARNRRITRSKAYEIILTIVKQVKSEELEFKLVDRSTWHTNLIYDYKVDKSENSISIQWNISAINLVSGSMLPGTYCYYDRRMGGVSSKKRYLMYELLQKHLYKDTFSIPVKFLREACCVEPEEYKEFKDLQKRLIKPTLKDIKDRLGIEITSSKARGDDKVEFVMVEKPKVTEPKVSVDETKDERHIRLYGKLLEEL